MQEHVLASHGEASFTEVLGHWLERMPYLLASVAIHALVGLLVAGFGFLRPAPSQAPVIEATVPPPPPAIEKREMPPPAEVEEVEPEEPVLQEAELPESEELEPLEVSGDVDFRSEAPFDRFDWNEAIGLGGGAGGKFGERGGRGHARRAGTPNEEAVRLALQWLADHQDPDEGYWDADDFWLHDPLPEEPPSDGAGDPAVDVGVTGLALLAFLGNNNTMSRGPYREVVRKGTQWLRRQQRVDGLFGDEVGNPTLYNHAIATMAVGEAWTMGGRSPILARNVRDAVRLILEARNPYGAWRYSLVPDGDNDTSITGWMVFALKTAEEGGIPVDRQAYAGARAWFDQMTDPATGRTGYAFGEGGGPGGPPSRLPGWLERFPPERSESLTAVSLLCRIFMSDATRYRSWREHPDYELLKKQVDLILSRPPVWDPEGGACDMYYWYYATFAMYQWGGEAWRTWRRAIEKALLPHQRRDGNFRGSWDPVGPWGEAGGRVYSTALSAIILEVYYRYAQILGAR